MKCLVIDSDHDTKNINNKLNRGAVPKKQNEREKEGREKERKESDSVAKEIELMERWIALLLGKYKITTLTC